MRSGSGSKLFRGQSVSRNFSFTDRWSDPSSLSREILLLQQQQLFLKFRSFNSGPESGSPYLTDIQIVTIILLISFSVFYNTEILREIIDSPFKSSHLEGSKTAYKQ